MGRGEVVRYMGSKARFAAALLAVILSGRLAEQTYVEPFIGGANIFDKVPGPKIGADLNGFLVAMWGAVRDGWRPPEDVSVEDYREAKRQSQTAARTLPDAEIGFIGAGCSFGGKWFGGFARGGFNANGEPRVYSRESARAVLKQAPGLRGAIFAAGPYDSLSLPSRSLIYCDPPYAGVTGYTNAFDTAAFWRWCDARAADGHTVFVSEYRAPGHWRPVWEQETLSSVSRESRSGKRAVERLFAPA